MAFRYSGVNWEGRRWQTVGSVTALGHQVEQLRTGAYPQDGTVASKAHDKASPKSDHRPDKNGDVRAIDVGGPQSFLDAYAEALGNSRDPRLRYVIFNGRILRSYRIPFRTPWKWYRYRGSNPHDRHVHLSVVSTAIANDPSPWQLPEPEEDEMTIKQGDSGNTVIKIQQGLNGNLEIYAPQAPQLVVDGIFGSDTYLAVRSFQAGADLPVTGEVGGIEMALLMEYVPDKIDDHTEPGSDGITQSEADIRYALKPHRHEVVGETT